ncbi:hypothetical protein [Variovorax sp. OV329]|uniref:hypothetical protein n=1 Tax=Variovorax sp. OV329 TaxID=1882825 RepID=UPI0008F14249|nr:hypothetical protein [Variovorax sp. OV329]SFN19518.1 hypothetical protein SAMN05444747_117113 [Variovorax sp. OV329]
MASQISGSVYRIDKFAVPADALPAFLKRLHWIDQAVAALPGCRQNRVMTERSGSEFNVATLVEWNSPEALAAARAQISRRYAEEGFDPTDFMKRLGVRADMGLFSGA